MGSSNHSEVRKFVGEALENLSTRGVTWEVEDVVDATPTAPPRAGLPPGRHLLITIVRTDDRADRFQVHFTLSVDWLTASVATANQLQDQIIDYLAGAPVPSCPGHSHPLKASPETGRAMWICPVDSSHYSMPVSK